MVRNGSDGGRALNLHASRSRSGYSSGGRKLRAMADASEVEFIFEPQEDGGYYVYAPDLPGLHTQGETLDEAKANAEEALALYVEGLREEGRTTTVLRALRALRDEGLLEMRPRRGIRVVGTPAESELRSKVAELVQLARQRGYTRTDLLKMVTNAS